MNAFYFSVLQLPKMYLWVTPVVIFGVYAVRASLDLLVRSTVSPFV